MNYPFLIKQGQGYQGLGYIHTTIDGWVDKEWVQYITDMPVADLAKLLDLESLRFSVGFKFSYSQGGGFGITLQEFSSNQLAIMMDIVRYRLEHGTSTICE